MVCAPAWRKAVTCIFSLPKTLQSLATPEFSWAHCYFLLSVSFKTPRSNHSGVCCIFSDVWPHSAAHLPGLGLWCVGRGQVWGAAGAAQPSPGRAPVPLPFSSRFPSLVQRGAGVCLEQCKTDFSSVLGMSLPVPLAFVMVGRAGTLTKLQVLF